ncbi:MAG: DJ-1/PfpI family protein [Pseudomonadales bacterium]
MSDSSPPPADAHWIVGGLIFPGFELLDLYGPLEMFGASSKHFTLVTIAETAEPVPSAQGPSSTVQRTFAECGDVDILLVPGGIGTRKEAANPALLTFLRNVYPQLDLLASVCTGAGLLAAAGLLEGRRATTNKLSFAWPRSRGPNTVWVPEARWVEDGNVFTSAGVAAGMDMSLALIARLLGEAAAEEVARYTEYEWHRDADRDPFARRAGLL